LADSEVQDSAAGIGKDSQSISIASNCDNKSHLSARINDILADFNFCLSAHVDNYTIIIATKCTRFLLLKSQDNTI
jgi:hypothetical protein